MTPEERSQAANAGARLFTADDYVEVIDRAERELEKYERVKSAAANSPASGKRSVRFSTIARGAQLPVFKLGALTLAAK